MRIFYLCILCFIACTSVNKQGETNKEVHTGIKPDVIEEKEKPEIVKIYNSAYNNWFNGASEIASALFLFFIKNNPNSTLADDAQRYLADCYIRLENYDQAKIEYKELFENYPNSDSYADGLYEYAHFLFFQLREFDNAKPYFEKFMENATVKNERLRDYTIDLIDNWEEKIKDLEER